MTELIEALQRRGEVAAGFGADFGTSGLGQVVFSTLNQAFVDFVKDDDMTLDALRDSVTAQILPLAAMMAATGATMSMVEGG